MKKRLEELETKSSQMADDYELRLSSQKILSKSAHGSISTLPRHPSPLASHHSNGPSLAAEGSVLQRSASKIELDQSKTEAKERIKAKFRSRSTEKKRQGGNGTLKEKARVGLESRTVGIREFRGGIMNADEEESYTEESKSAHHNIAALPQHSSSLEFRNSKVPSLTGEGSVLQRSVSQIELDQSKTDAKERIKAKFRSRSTEKKRQIGNGTLKDRARAGLDPGTVGIRAYKDRSMNGDEGASGVEEKSSTGKISQRMAFYERSLKAAEKYAR